MVGPMGRILWFARVAMGCTLCIVLGAPSTAAAQGFIIPELGARKNGTGAAIGRPDDLSAIYHNPGALTQLSGTRVGLSLGLAFLDVSLRLAPWSGSGAYIKDPVDSQGYYPEQNPSVLAPIPMIGISTNLWSDDLVGAFGVYVPNAAGAKFGADKPSRYHIIDAYVFSAFFTAAVAWRPVKWLSVGLGASVVYIRVERSQLLFPVIDGTDYSGMIGGNTELKLKGSDVKPAFNLGVQIWPHPTVSIGLMALSAYNVALEGPLTLKLADPESMFNTPDFTQNQQKTEIKAPWIVGIGFNWDITPWLELGAEFRYYFNSSVEEQRTSITEGDILKTLLPDGLVTPKNLHDSFHTGGGFVVRPPLPIDLDVMTGVHYELSSTPDNTVEVSAPTFDLLGVHLGGRWHWRDKLSLSLIYSHYWYFERTTKNSITSPPTNFNGSAATNQVTLVLEWKVARGLGTD